VVYDGTNFWRACLKSPTDWLLFQSYLKSYTITACMCQSNDTRCAAAQYDMFEHALLATQQVANQFLVPVSCQGIILHNFQFISVGCIPSRTKRFSLQRYFHTGSGAHSASYTMGTGVVSLGVKWLGHEADHSPPSSTQVKNGAIPPLPRMSSWRPKVNLCLSAMLAKLNIGTFLMVPVYN
jgi:hypothetical protein